MKKDRIFGFNVRFYLKEKQIPIQKAASELGYSEADFLKILTRGEIYTVEEKNKISQYLGIPLKKMRLELDDEKYQWAGCYHTVGHFSDSKSRDKILDLIDNFIELQETIDTIKPQ